MSTNTASVMVPPTVEQLVILREGVELGEFETSFADSPLWVSARGKHFQVRGVAREVVLCLRDGCRTVSEIRDAIAKTDPDRVPVDQVTETVNRLVNSSIVQYGSESSSSPPKGSGWKLRSAGYFATYVPILSQERLRPITTKLAVLFDPYWMVRLLPVLLIVQIVFWLNSGPRLIGSIASLNQSRFLLFLLCNYAGLFLHELGHAAACTRCGVKHGPIGFGIYLVFPAFYADVSDAWRLPNRKRMIIDAGGVYVTLILAWIALMVYLTTGSAVAEILTAVYGLTAFFSLNPFLRMDGYWLVSDALGIPNLMTANREVTEWGLSKLFRHNGREPQIWCLPERVRRMYFIYYSLFLVFLCYGTCVFYIWYLPRLLHSYPQLLLTFNSAYQTSGLSLATITAGFRIALGTVPAVGMLIYTGRFLYRTMESTGRAMWKAVRGPIAGLSVGG